MKITELHCLHAHAGFRNFDFLKLTTDAGLVGWSEFSESFGGAGVTTLIQKFAPTLIGADARAYETLVATLYAIRRQCSGGVVQQSIGAIENALLDVKAKALGIPVYEMLGGPVRDKLRLYWSHCGTYRVAWPEEMQIPAVSSPVAWPAPSAQRRVQPVSAIVSRQPHPSDVHTAPRQHTVEGEYLGRTATPPPARPTPTRAVNASRAIAAYQSASSATHRPHHRVDALA